jgi:hypothetical protein
MTSPNEICICGHEEEIHIKGKNSDGSCKAIIGYDNDGEEIFCSCQKFKPKIEKTEVQTICPLGETIPDFTQEIEKTGFSTPNCEICKDYPKEYWCGNPENKVSTSNEEIIKDYFFDEIRKTIKIDIKTHEFEELIRKIVLSLKEQEVSKITDEYYNWMKIATDYEKKYKQLLSSYYKLQDTLLIERNNKNQFLSSLQEKIEERCKHCMIKEELQKIFQEMGQ